MRVVFDVGLVLIQANLDWESAIQASGLNVVKNPFGSNHLYSLPQYEEYERGDIDSDEYLGALCRHFDMPSRADALALHRAILGPEYTGVADLIEELINRGIDVATLSNNNPLHWEWIAQQGPYPGVQRIEHKWASFLLGATKPSLDIYRALERQLGWHSEEIIFFDDSEKYVQGARSANWSAFQILPGISPVKQIRKLLPAFD